MKCENCLHYETCGLYTYDVLLDRTVYYKERDLEDVENRCSNFADKDLYIKLSCKVGTKDLYIKLPCKIGTKVYALATPCGGCEHYNLSLEQSLKICRNCEKREIAECTFDIELIDEFGKTVFLTREDAEKKLEELKNE